MQSSDFRAPVTGQAKPSLARVWVRRVVFLPAALALAYAAGAQTPPDDRYDEEGRPKRATEIPKEGFWPTRLMAERMFDRIVDEMANEYEFDEEQKAVVRETFGRNMLEFMDTNRAEIQTLMNQFFEAQFNDGPPEVDDVAFWSQRVLPLVEEFRGVADRITGDMREVMTDDQAARLDTEYAAFQAGLTLVTNKLGSWAEGNYDPETEWITDRSERQRREAEEQARMEAEMERARAQAGGPDAEEALARANAAEARARALAEGNQRGGRPTTRATDEWEQWVDKQIERYEMNEEQQQKARLILRAKQEERDQYLERKADDLAKAKAALAEAQSDDARKAAAEAQARLNAPVERMFEQLRDKVGTLVTRDQRRRAAEREAAAAPTDAPASRPRAAGP